MAAPEILSLLREHCMGKKKMKTIKYNNEDYVAFDEYAFPKDAVTPLKVYGKQDDYYNLASLIFFWENRELMHQTYVKETAAKGIRAVTRINRRELTEYLSGTKQDVPSFFDPTYPPAAPIPTSRLKDETSEPERKKPKLDSVDRPHRIDSILNKSTDDKTGIRALNSNLTAEMIYSLKKKKQLNQKKNVINIPDPSEEFGISVGTDREFVIKRERIWETRANCMDSKTKDFHYLIELWSSLKRREAAEEMAKKTGVEIPVPKPANKTSIHTKGAGYSRYDQEIFTKEMNHDFNIDAEMSFVGQNLNNLIKPAAPRRGPHTSTSPPLRTSNIPKPPPQPANKPKTAEPPVPKRRTNKTPIIIIPPCGGMGGTLINMYNVRDVLQEMTFKTPDEKKNTGMKRETEVQLHRKRGEVTVPYRVIENPTRLSEEEWDRVVAVFVMGPAWQFKGWKYNGNPVEIFSHIPAFHIHYEDLKIDKNVAQWSVTYIPISRDKRHLDKARLAKFWDVLDKHMIKHKSHLRF